jgi:DNA-binding NarL/FixJ family response regulator
MKVGPRKRVLIVDDHPLVRTALRTIVDRYSNLQVIGEAVDGPDAIRAVGDLAPHLVLMDMTMPGMNGIEATAEIKRRYPHVRVLIVTMHNSEEYIRASLEAGADGYVVKDAGMDEFRAAIRQALRRAPS